MLTINYIANILCLNFLLAAAGGAGWVGFEQTVGLNLAAEG